MSLPKTQTIQTSDEGLDRLGELFDKAIAMSPEARASFLQELARADRALHDDLASLLDAHFEAETFLENAIGPRLVESIEKHSAPPVLEKGDVIGDFEILGPLGVGGLASVYLARQRSLGREVALKISPNRGQEARLMAHLEHDHIVKVYSEQVDKERDLRLICMQYVPGASLERIFHKLSKLAPRGLRGSTLLEVVDRLNQHTIVFHPASFRFRELLAGLDYAEAVIWIGTRLADALEYAHQRDILHLDVKPGNILLNAYGRPFLSDFNIALSRHGSSEAAAEVFGGTAKYMSPEQSAVFSSEDPGAAATRIDPRSDIFSLGVLLEEFMEKGRDPVSSAATLASSPSKMQWEAVARRCQDPDREKRFASAGALSRALQECLELCKIEKALPKAPELLFRYPVLALVACALIPQLMGSLVNISYNGLRIASRLSAPQGDFFKLLIVLYNPIIYAICVGIWIGQLRRLKRFLEAGPLSREALDKARRHTLSLPRLVVIITSLGWMPGSLLFPLAIHLHSGPLPAAVFGHFFVSFALSWLVALAYSVLYTQFICLRTLYPRFLSPESSIRQTAREELMRLGPQIRLYYFLIGFIPLIGAMLIIFSGPDRLDPSSYWRFCSLVNLLITLGMVGVFLGFRQINKLARTLSALTGSG